MAKFADVNNTTSTGTTGTYGHVIVMFVLKAVLKAAGWTVPRSSDGLTYNATGDQITGANVGAGGLMNTGAWYVLREPGGRREWCVQVQMSNSAQVRVKYSASARFSGGAPGVLVTPTATDQQVLLGAGTDGSPTYNVVLASGGTAYRYHIVANSVPVSGAYYFCLFCTNVAGASQTSGLIVQEPLAPGSFHESDVDPVLVTCGPHTTWTSLACWYGYGTGSQVWVLNMTIVFPTIFNGSLGTELVSNTDVNVKPWYYQTVASAPRMKGIGAFVAQKGPARTYPATMNTATDAYVYLGSVMYPYPDNTVPSVA